MTKYNKYLLPLFYLGVICVMVMSVILVLSGIRGYIKESPKYDYTIDDVFMSDIMGVAGTNNDGFIRPYISDKVSIKRYFYDKNDDEEKQKSSIIFYENTYIQNKGVDYVSNEDFDVVSILDGEVTNIENSELYGTIVTVKYNNNLEIRYCNLANVLITLGYKTSQGEIIGITNRSKFDDNLSLLHLEIKYNNEYINPETIYTLNVSSFK